MTARTNTLLVSLFHGAGITNRTNASQMSENRGQRSAVRVYSAKDLDVKKNNKVYKVFRAKTPSSHREEFCFYSPNLAPCVVDRFDRLTTLSPSKGGFAARSVEYLFHRSVIFLFTALFHGASLVEYRLDRGRVVCRSGFPQSESSFFRPTSDLLFLIS